jgi:hypothetical protein
LLEKADVAWEFGVDEVKGCVVSDFGYSVSEIFALLSYYAA